MILKYSLSSNAHLKNNHTARQTRYCNSDIILVLKFTGWPLGGEAVTCKHFAPEKVIVGCRIGDAESDLVLQLHSPKITPTKILQSVGLFVGLTFHKSLSR